MQETFSPGKNADELGLDKSAYFSCNVPGHEYHRMVVTLAEDDDSTYPFFKDVSGNKNYNMVIKWKDLRYATKEEIEECERKHCIVDKPKQSNVLLETDTDILEHLSIAKELLNNKIVESPVQEKQELKINIMQDIIKFAKNMILSSDEKVLRKTGLKDDNGAFTETAWELTKQKLMQDNERSLIDIAKAKEEEDKVCKK